MPGTAVAGCIFERDDAEAGPCGGILGQADPDGRADCHVRRVVRGTRTAYRGRHDVQRPEVDSVSIHGNAGAVPDRVSRDRDRVVGVVGEVRGRVDSEHVCVKTDRALDCRCPCLEGNISERRTLHAVAAQRYRDRLVNRNLDCTVHGTGCGYRKGRAEAEDVLAFWLPSLSLTESAWMVAV